MDVRGVAAIVTGGASALGGATATMLVEAGALVSILDLNVDIGKAKAQEIAGKFFAVDVTDEAAVDAALAQVEREYGKPRILDNCAGIAPAHKVTGRDGNACALGGFSKVVSVNLIGTFNMLSKFAAGVADSDPIGEERGVIVYTASVAAFEGQIGQAAYAASKGGVVGMTLPVARELARYGIGVVAIAPGLFLTPMVAAFPVEVQESLGKQVPFPSRLGRPEEYAHMVGAIIANPMLNGEVIRLDGAIRMAHK